MKYAHCGKCDMDSNQNFGNQWSKAKLALFLFSLVLSGLQISAQAATLNVPAQYETIQEAIDAAANGDEVVVAPGEYLENIQFRGKNITLRSQEPDNPDVVETTIIDGDRAGSVVTFDGTEGPECLLAGFTITNGYALKGGGINGYGLSGEGEWEGEMEELGTHATIEHNWIIGNTAGPPAEGFYYIEGGGAFRCHGRIRGNVIAESDVLPAFVCHPDDPTECEEIAGYGGGLYICGGVIENNLIAQNRKSGISRCKGPIRNNFVCANITGYAIAGAGDGVIGNIVAGNMGTGVSGGAVSSSGRNGGVIGNLLIDNAGHAVEFSRNVQGNAIVGGLGRQADHIIGGSTGVTGNVFLNAIAGSAGLIAVSTDVIGNLVRNCTTRSAAPITDCKGLIANNTIVNNRTQSQTVGIQESPQAIIINNILWGNRGFNGSAEQISYSSLPTYCCIENDTSGEPTNISLDPKFVDAEHGDFSLMPDSPCIDAGAYVAEAPLDIVGRARGFDGSAELRGDGSDFDIGAYEFVRNVVGEGEGEGEGASPLEPHDADQNADGHISASELLRVIQFYNSYAYHCATGTEDGYAPGMEEAPERYGHGELRSATSGTSAFPSTTWERTEDRGLSQASESSSLTGRSLISGEWEFVNPLEVERSPIVSAYMKKHGIKLPEVPEEHIRLWKAWVTKHAPVRSSSFSLSSEDSLKAELRTKDNLKVELRTSGCTYHSSDYAPKDWTISITELLRTIQFFNTPGGYIACDYGEDGYCPAVGG